MQERRIVLWAAFTALMAAALPVFSQQDKPPILYPHTGMKTSPKVTGATLLVKCDLACNWKLDGEVAGLLDEGEPRKKSVSLGQHIVEAATTDGLDKTAQQIIDIKNAGQKLVLLNLLPVRTARLKAELETRNNADQSKNENDRSEPKSIPTADSVSPTPKPGGEQEARLLPVQNMQPSSATLVVRCDLACNWKLDGGSMGSIREGSESNRIAVFLGQHRVEATTDDGQDKKNVDFEAKSAGRTIELMIDLLTDRTIRLKAEKTTRDKAVEEQKEKDKKDSLAIANDRYQQGVELFHQKRYPEAKPLLEAACNAHNVKACNNLGLFYMNGSGVPQDYFRAMTIFTQTCDAGENAGCINLGDLYHEGKGVEKNDIRAVELFSKACDAGNSTGCTNLGNMYHFGSGVARDDSRALVLYTRACNAGDGQGCNNLGIMYDNGWGISKDDSLAVNLYVKSCIDENADGCGNLGNHYRLGLGIEKDTGKARLFLNKSCTMSNQWGCDRLKELDANISQSSAIGSNPPLSLNQPAGVTSISPQLSTISKETLPTGVYHVGGNISAPYQINQVEAEFTPEAKQAKYQGDCIVSIIVDAQGNPQNPRVLRPLGMGLNEKAIQAVMKFKFHPAMKDGKTPVAVPVNIEIKFRLY
jgi:hypothetical protein